jgi:hypothetical protein
MQKVHTSIFILTLLVLTVANAAGSESRQEHNAESSGSNVTDPVTIMLTERTISGGLALARKHTFHKG